MSKLSLPTGRTELEASVRKKSLSSGFFGANWIHANKNWPASIYSSFCDQPEEKFTSYRTIARTVIWSLCKFLSDAPNKTANESLDLSHAPLVGSHSTVGLARKRLTRQPLILQIFQNDFETAVWSLLVGYPEESTQQKTGSLTLDQNQLDINKILCGLLCPAVETWLCANQTYRPITCTAINAE